MTNPPLMSANTMRFKATITFIGKPNDVLQQVKMRFRISLFWNDPESNIPKMKEELKLEGRRIAKYNNQNIDVPQVALINSVNFSVTSKAQVHSLNNNGNGLLRWTCEYEADMKQDMDIKDFPYDIHDLKLEFGISVWKKVGTIHETIEISPAEEKDNEKKCDLFGKVEEHVRVVGFERKGLKFNVLRKDYGALSQRMEFYIPIRRIHTPMHQNIVMPLLLIHTIAIFSLAHPIKEVNSRVGSLLAIAFLEIGIRFTFDSKLPTVDYSIYIQQMVNCLLYTLLLLVIESYLLYFFIIRIFEGEELQLIADIIDGVSAFFAMVPLIWIAMKTRVQDKKADQWDKKNHFVSSLQQVFEG